MFYIKIYVLSYVLFYVKIEPLVWLVSIAEEDHITHYCFCQKLISYGKNKKKQKWSL